MAITGIKWNDTARHLIGCEPLKDYYKIRLENAGTLIECKFASINETHRRYIVDVITNMFRDDMASESFYANITHDNAKKWRVVDMVNHIKNELKNDYKFVKCNMSSMYGTTVNGESGDK